MDKIMIIRLKEAGRSNRSIERELGINRKTVARYWKKHLELKKLIESNPLDCEAKEQLIAKPKYSTKNRNKRKYTKELDDRVNELINSEEKKNRQLGAHKKNLLPLVFMKS